KRIVEDAAVVSPESISLFGQTYFIGNVRANLDAAHNLIGFKFTPGGALPAGCDPNLVVDPVTDTFNNVLGAICYKTSSGDPGADSKPDGFPDPTHIYRGLAGEVNKRFANNWQLLRHFR